MATRLSTFQFTFNYLPGSSKDAADALCHRADYASSVGGDGVNSAIDSNFFVLLEKEIFVDLVEVTPRVQLEFK